MGVESTVGPYRLNVHLSHVGVGRNFVRQNDDARFLQLVLGASLLGIDLLLRQECPKPESKIRQDRGAFVNKNQRCEEKNSQENEIESMYVET